MNIMMDVRARPWCAAFGLYVPGRGAATCRMASKVLRNPVTNELRNGETKDLRMNLNSERRAMADLQGCGAASQSLSLLRTTLAV
jgi:hypothetical protein